MSSWRRRHDIPDYGSFLWIYSKLDRSSFQDSLVGWRKKAAGEPSQVFSCSTFSLLSTAQGLHKAGVQIQTQNDFGGLAFNSNKTNEGNKEFCVTAMNGRLYLSQDNTIKKKSWLKRASLYPSPREPSCPSMRLPSGVGTWKTPSPQSPLCPQGYYAFEKSSLLLVFILHSSRNSTWVTVFSVFIHISL